MTSACRPPAGISRAEINASRDHAWSWSETEVRSARTGSKGQRWYAWTWIAAGSRHYLLVRRHLTSSASLLAEQAIELPSWAFGNSGTRFKVFGSAGTARDPYEKIADVAA
ncbi:hypothetical protein C8E87_0604 [Paractinoplanes brasiliensis]|uniref:Uncharacterized protein n=1 Tax=Paractinoplanes brasiliensis TaxID=52695 RepID=A0A4R6JNQ9_9ACTN|nr:hypothetical protein C8E87_0604 [Actinoplanes brasiliensis]GID30534.1 hypothetical protein Abr02nite_55170 [Actinoplanes brasiliensis]